MGWLIKKYVKKPIVIEAIQWEGDESSLMNIMEFGAKVDYEIEDGRLLPWIETLEGNMRFHPDDYIVKGIQGEFYPVDYDIFKKTYDKVED